MFKSKRSAPSTPSFVRRAHGYMEIMLQDMPTDFPEFMLEEMGYVRRDDLTEEPDEAPPEDSPFEETPLVFGPDQPDCLFEGEGNLPYRGQEAAKRNLLLEIRSLYRRSPEERFKTLLVGPAGLGKTSLGWVVAKLIQDRQEEVSLPRGSAIELLPAQIATKERLDAFFEWVVQDPYRIVLVDEVHTLTDLEAWFPVLHDTGSPYYPMASGRRLEVPKTISWIAMTTNPGELDRRAEGALRRRLQPEIELADPSKEDLAAIIEDLGRVNGLQVTSQAAQQIAERSMYPWQAKMIFEKAQKIASLAYTPVVSSTHAQEAFTILGLDERGLLPPDRKVLRALLFAPYQLATRSGITRYRMSEEALCSSAGVDRVTYKKKIQPKLIRLGLLTTVGGQSLTEAAVAQYGWLKTA